MELTTKARMADQADSLTKRYHLVIHNNVFYLPKNYITGHAGPCGPDVQVWVPLSRDDIRRLANVKSNILFASESELNNFQLLLKQLSEEIDVSDDPDAPSNSLLICTADGLKVVNKDGQLEDTDGEFRPNFIKHHLNDDPVMKAKVFDTIANWLDSEEEAHSLLYHLATALAPGWSAVKYILLLGEGRNGKSVLLTMLKTLFGKENVSGVTRQKMAEQSPVCHELNGKLLNIVFDGEQNWIKDSSTEKTLIAGEPVFVKLLYESGLTQVQTTALFLEGLNQEPKSRDKSSALQKRLARFRFPKVFPKDRSFERHMVTEEVLGAFLSLLIDHFVKEDELAEKLALSQVSVELQVEQGLVNSPVHQYIQHLYTIQPSTFEDLEQAGLDLEDLVGGFMAWRLQEGFSEFSTEDSRRMFKAAFEVKRSSRRTGTGTVNYYAVKAAKPDVQALLDHLKGSDEDAEVQPDALVGE